LLGYGFKILRLYFDYISVQYIKYTRDGFNTSEHKVSLSTCYNFHSFILFAGDSVLIFQARVESTLRNIARAQTVDNLER
jgi:hypothetical protein